jgi:NMD protein affecting ribosome stability and mRNA decay
MVFTDFLQIPTQKGVPSREEMNVKHLPHKHVQVVRHELRQRGGIPYEVEQKVCSSCGRVLDERPLKRAAA